MLTIHCPECGKCSRVPEDAPDDDGLVCCPRCAADFTLDDKPPPRKKKSHRREERRPSRFRCPFCGSREPPLTRQQVSGEGIFVFCLLLLFCFPLCFIGLLLTKTTHTCADCGVRMD